MYGALVCDKPHPLLLPITRLFSTIRGFCALVSGSMRAGAGAGGGVPTAGSQMILLILLTLLFLS